VTAWSASLSDRFAMVKFLHKFCIALWVWSNWWDWSPLGQRWKPNPMFGSSVGPYLIVVGAPVQSLILSCWVVVRTSCLVDPTSSQAIICHFVLWYAREPPVRLLTSFQPCALKFIFVVASAVGLVEL